MNDYRVTVDPFNLRQFRSNCRLRPVKGDVLTGARGGVRRGVIKTRGGASASGGDHIRHASLCTATATVDHNSRECPKERIGTSSESQDLQMLAFTRELQRQLLSSWTKGMVPARPAGKSTLVNNPRLGRFTYV